MTSTRHRCQQIPTATRNTDASTSSLSRPETAGSNATLLRRGECRELISCPRDRPPMAPQRSQIANGALFERKVAKRDRLARDVIAVAMIKRLVIKRGATIVSAAGEGTGSGDDRSALL